MAFRFGHGAHTCYQRLLLSPDLCCHGTALVLPGLALQIVLISKGIIHYGLIFKYHHRICHLPDKIPVVKQDFIFSAVSEELGGIFALCLIMVCFSCFLMFLNIAMQMKDQFYKLVALGLGTIYAFQVFLTIGGVTKFIPSTGVTLPLVSYGGSSLLSSMIIFAVIQGLYILRQDEGEINASKSRKNRQNRKKTTGFENADIEKLS